MNSDRMKGQQRILWPENRYGKPFSYSAQPRTPLGANFHFSGVGEVAAHGSSIASRIPHSEKQVDDGFNATTY